MAEILQRRTTAFELEIFDSSGVQIKDGKQGKTRHRIGITNGGWTGASSTGLSLISRSSGLGDLTVSEINQIQNIVNQAERPLEVVGSAANGTRRGIGSNLPIGKGIGTRSDIDYVVPHGSIFAYEGGGLNLKLPSIGNHGIVPGTHNPFIGPAVRFEPYANPFFVPMKP